MYRRVNIEQVKYLSEKGEHIAIFSARMPYMDSFCLAPEIGGRVVLNKTCIIAIFSLSMNTYASKSHLEG